MTDKNPAICQHTFRPDIFTSSDQYAGRFAGDIGQFFLQVQAEKTFQLLSSNSDKLKILEVGGGHGQLTEQLLKAGHSVHIHGSDQVCFKRVRCLESRYPHQLSFLEMPLERFNPEASTYDVVIAFRLLAHVSDWRDFVRRIALGARRQLILDIASLTSFSILTPLLFPIKKRIEGNTREYYCHSTKVVSAFLLEQGFSSVGIAKEFFFPMGMHRALGCIRLSESAEHVARKSGLTALFGSPCIISATR